MPTKEFSNRLLLDKDFYEKTIKTSNERLLMKLMYINAKSKEYKRNHNLMSQKSFDEILSKKKDEDRASAEGLLKASFRPIDAPKSIEEIEDEIERNIKHAVELASKSPFKTTILTTDEKVKKYKQNKHYQNAKYINVISGKEAIGLINEYHGEVILT